MLELENKLNVSKVHICVNICEEIKKIFGFVGSSVDVSNERGMNE